MGKILIVDDESSVLETLKASLNKFYPERDVLSAGDGLEATAILSKEQIDLVISDVRMPRRDGIDLLLHISAKYPNTQCIMMTSFQKPPILETKENKSIYFLPKPFAIHELIKAVKSCFDSSHQESFIKGVLLVSFLQLFSLEEKTCLLQVKAGDKKKGVIYINKGDVHDAAVGDCKGEDAIYKMLSWEKVDLSYHTPPPKRKFNRYIFEDITALVMKGLEKKEELETGSQKGSETLEGESADLAREAEAIIDVTGNELAAFDELLFPQADDYATKAGVDFKTEQNDSSSTENNTTHLKEKSIMALENLLNDLKDINGYRAAAIMNFTGEILASHASDTKLDLATTGATFNDIFRQAHAASNKIGLDACSECVIMTPKGIIIMNCSGVQSKVHFHLIAVMTADGNQALMKMKILKLIDPILKELA